MKTIRLLLAAAAVAACGPALAADACTKNFVLGSMGPPADKTFASGFFAAGNFADCYDFSIAAASDAKGTTTEWNWDFSGLLGLIDVLTVRLFNTTSGRVAVGAADTTPESFSFANLAAGSYQLVVSGTTSQGSLATMVAYTGSLQTRTATVAAPVPEPELALLVALGLGGAAFAARRRQG